MKFERKNLDKLIEKYGDDFSYYIPRHINGVMTGIIVSGTKIITLKEGQEIK